MSLLVALVLAVAAVRLLLQAQALERGLGSCRYREFQAKTDAADRKRFYAVLVVLTGAILGTWGFLPFAALVITMVGSRFIP